MQKGNWSGFVIDGSRRHIARPKSSYFFWKYDLKVGSVFIPRENINSLQYLAV